MDVGTSLVNSSIEETLAALDGLFQTDQAKRSRYLRQLESAVAGLGVGTPPDFEPEPGGRLGDRPNGRAPRTVDPEPPPFIALPQRTTHGGPFGPAVRARLYAAALEKEGRW